MTWLVKISSLNWENRRPVINLIDVDVYVTPFIVRFKLDGLGIWFQIWLYAGGKSIINPRRVDFTMVIVFIDFTVLTVNL